MTFTFVCYKLKILFGILFFWWINLFLRGNISVISSKVVNLREFNIYLNCNNLNERNVELLRLDMSWTDFKKIVQMYTCIYISNIIVLCNIVNIMDSNSAHLAAFVIWRPEFDHWWELKRVCQNYNRVPWCTLKYMAIVKYLAVPLFMLSYCTNSLLGRLLEII